jgi:hypothetical protein
MASMSMTERTPLADKGAGGEGREDLRLRLPAGRRIIDEDRVERRLNHRFEGKSNRLADLPVFAKRKPDLSERKSPGRKCRQADRIAEGLIGEKLT